MVSEPGDRLKPGGAGRRERGAILPARCLTRDTHVYPEEARAVTIREATSAEDVALAARLFREYADGLGIDLSFQGFEQELAGLPAPYTRPQGLLLLAECDGAVAGCVGLRRFADGVGEVKRLYVLPRHRGQSVGLVLMRRLIAEARAIGYGRLLLDTLPSMTSARRLYAALGFRPTAAYYDNPIPGTAYMELVLD